MEIDMNRRAFLAGLGAVGTAAIRPLATRAQATHTRLILLGVAGGPSPKKMYAAPSQVIVVGDRAYVIDCGNGVARQLVLAGIPLTSLRHVFVTHHHSDHNADYGNLWSLAWAAGLQTPVDKIGRAHV